MGWFIKLQIFKAPSAENLDYADADFKEIYDYGPVSYKHISKEAVAKKKAERAKYLNKSK